MKLVVFAGPTIEASAIQSFVDAEVMGPASFGDIFRAAQSGAGAIAIIDGYFDRVAAVWHKEVLWAMAEGVHVFGAASMGALRAAELTAFGMRGVGEVFRAFRAGELEDDDEVAVAHGSAETGFSGSSDAMVNIRATLRRAVASSVLSTADADSLERLAKARFYPERSYGNVLQDATAAGTEPSVLARLRDWLPAGRVDLKRDDAVALLQHLRDFLHGDTAPKKVAYHFNATDAWHQAMRLATQRSRPQKGSDLSDLDEELKLTGARQAAWNAAALRGVALRSAEEAGIRPDRAATRTAAEQLRRGLGLLEEGSLRQWCAEQRLTDAEALRFFEDQARLAWAAPIFEEQARSNLIDHLRSVGSYGSLADKVVAKNALKQTPSSASAELERLGLTEPDLWRWYFSDKLRRSAPKDLEGYALQAGFRNLGALRQAVVRELAFDRSRAARTESPIE